MAPSVHWGSSHEALNGLAELLTALDANAESASTGRPLRRFRRASRQSPRGDTLPPRDAALRRLNPDTEELLLGAVHPSSLLAGL
jgi:hypothetical protein